MKPEIEVFSIFRLNPEGDFMKRWIWTILITLSLGMSLGACGSKKGGSGATPAPADPNDPADPVDPQCDPTTQNCAGDRTKVKTSYGAIRFATDGSRAIYKKLLKEYIGCDSIQGINFFGLNIGGSYGNLSCDSYRDAAIFFHVEGDLQAQNRVWVYLRITCSDWTCGTTFYDIPLIQGAVLSRTNNNTGYAVRGTVNNDEYRFRLDNQDLIGPLRIEVDIRYYGLSHSNFVVLGTVDGYDIN